MLDLLSIFSYKSTPNESGADLDLALRVRPFVRNSEFNVSSRSVLELVRISHWDLHLFFVKVVVDSNSKHSADNPAVTSKSNLAAMSK